MSDFLNREEAGFLMARLDFATPEQVLDIAYALTGAAGDAFDWAAENDPDSEFAKVFTDSFRKRLTAT